MFKNALKVGIIHFVYEQIIRSNVCSVCICVNVSKHVHWSACDLWPARALMREHSNSLELVHSVSQKPEPIGRLLLLSWRWASALSRSGEALAIAPDALRKIKYLISACVWNKGWDKVFLVTYENEIKKQTNICTVMLDEIGFEWANINISGFALMCYSHTKIHIYVCEHTGTCRGEKKKCHCSIPTGEEPFAPDN